MEENTRPLQDSEEAQAGPWVSPEVLLPVEFSL